MDSRGQRRGPFVIIRCLGDFCSSSRRTTVQIVQREEDGTGVDVAQSKLKL